MGRHLLTHDRGKLEVSPREKTVFLGVSNMDFHEIPPGNTVPIGEEEIITSGRLDCPVQDHRLPEPLIFMPDMDEGEVEVPPSPVHYLPCPWARAIICHYYLEVRVALFRIPREDVLQRSRLVIRGHDHR